MLFSYRRYLLHLVIVSFLIKLQYFLMQHSIVFDYLCYEFFSCALFQPTLWVWVQSSINSVYTIHVTFLWNNMYVALWCGLREKHFVAVSYKCHLYFLGIEKIVHRNEFLFFILGTWIIFMMTQCHPFLRSCSKILLNMTL